MLLWVGKLAGFGKYFKPTPAQKNTHRFMPAHHTSTLCTEKLEKKNIFQVSIFQIDSHSCEYALIITNKFIINSFNNQCKVVDAREMLTFDKSLMMFSSSLYLSSPHLWPSRGANVKCIRFSFRAFLQVVADKKHEAGVRESWLNGVATQR